MWKSFFKTLIRSLSKNKAFSVLNIVGLAIGIVCASLIFLWVEDELTYDSSNLKKDRLYMAYENQVYDTYVFTTSSTPGTMGPAMMQDIPGIANICRTSEGRTNLLFAQGDKSVYASGKYAEPSIFSMLTLPFVEGSAKTAFSQLHSVVITQSAAKKFFGTQQNVVGKTLRVDNKQDYVVSGVLKDIPSNSSIRFEWLMPFQVYWDQSPWVHVWGNNSISTYVELKPGANVKAIDNQLSNYIQKHSPKSLGHVFLYAMNDWHLRNEFKEGKLTGGGQIEYVRLFTFIAWIILLIACINFMNLATARSEKRAREVGVRKVLGAGKRSLIIQFIAEAILMAVISGIIAVVALVLLLPSFNTLVQKELTLGLGNPSHIVALLAIALICGLIAGSYPAFYLSGFNPVAVLKGLKLKDSGAALTRKALVLIQFSVSIILIICTIIVFKQIEHIKNRQLGFNKERLLQVPLLGDMAKHYQPAKQELLNSGQIVSVALSDYEFIYGGNNTDGLDWDGKPAGSKVLISQRYITPDFFKTAGMKLLEGRNLTESDTARPIRMIITKSLEKLMGKGSAVGKSVHYQDDSVRATVVGVVDDYVYGNMYGKPDPVMFFSATPKQCSQMYLRIKPTGDIQAALAVVQNVMKTYNPQYPFDYRFVDDQFNDMFSDEMLVSSLSRLFATLAIVISCLGLFGLAAYTAERRTKEIGIRKVLGASVSGITTLLSIDFLQLVVLSCIIAFPVAYWLMSNWLKGYQYRVDMQWWAFFAAGAAAVLIAFITISFQSVKAALANPAKSLRSE